MNRRTLFAAALAAALAALAPAAGAETGAYVTVNGFKTYYQVEGDGRPLVLLHGGICTIEACLGPLRAPLAKKWRTIAIEMQGHGRTADRDAPLSFDQMTKDVAAALQQLGIKNADVFGYSMGGTVAVLLAARHPELVRKVAIFGTGFSNDGLVPGLVENFKTLKASDLPEAFRRTYESVAPDPKGWPVLVEKIKGLVLTFQGIPPAEIGTIAAPLLVMAGDRDIIKPEHAVAFFRHAKHGQLAILPGADHFAPVQRAAWLLPLLEAFYESPLPAK